MSKAPLVIYHGPTCLDGLFAAAAMKGLLPNAEFVVGRYQSDDTVDFSDRDVYIVDFSYSAEQTLAICGMANKVVVIDHHKTAVENLENVNAPNLEKLLDVRYSGAMLAWLYSQISDREITTDIPDIIQHIQDHDLWRLDLRDTKFAWLYSQTGDRETTPHIPDIIRHIQDHDLWRFDLRDTKPLIAGLYAANLTIDDALDMIQTDYFVEEVFNGRILLDAKLKDCEKIIESSKRYINYMIGDIPHSFPTVNASFIHASDIGNILAEKEGVGVTYFDSENHRSFSFRSNGSVDVSAICKHFGGGGHANAAGFKVKRDHYLAGV